LGDGEGGRNTAVGTGVSGDGGDTLGFTFLEGKAGGAANGIGGNARGMHVTSGPGAIRFIVMVVMGEVWR